MLERIIRIVVPDQDNRSPTVSNWGRLLKMLNGMTTFNSRKTLTASGRANGLLWRPQPKAPPFGRGLVYFGTLGEQ